MRQEEKAVEAQESQGLALKIEGLTLGYDHKVVLQDIYLEVKRGEMLGIIGPNGCGKSTLIRGIGHILLPLAGSISLDGRNIRKLGRSQVAQRVAVVPQAPTLPPAFTVFEMVLLGRTPHLGYFRYEGQRDLAIVWQAMEATGTGHLAGRLVGELSGGEKQRVLIARALAQEPELLLLDEPTAHLDINYQLQTMDLVRGLCQERNITVIAALHDLNLAALYCHRLVMLREGRVYAQGIPQAVITPQAIKDVYGLEVQISPHPVSGVPVTFLVPGDSPKAKGDGPH